MTKRRFEDSPPDKHHLTGYDEAHLRDYLRLLDAAAECADWHEAVAIIFGVNPNANPAWAKALHDSHLARACWMAEIGYAYLLGPRLN